MTRAQTVGVGLLLGWAFSLPAVASAQTINAASCNSSDVQSALDSVQADGTTVNIPAGTCHWTTAVSYSQVYSTIIQGQTTVTGECSPGSPTCTATDNTLIYDDVASTAQALVLDTATGKTLRLTGISVLYDPSNTAVPYGGQVTISGGAAVRVDHCDFFVGPSGAHGVQTYDVLGVADHNFFNATGVTNDFSIADPGWNGDPQGLGDGSWADGDHFGSDQFWFIENNAFTNGWAFDCEMGGRYVFRYNVVGPNTPIQTHGLTPDRHRGCRSMEVYGNDFTYSSDPTNINFAFMIMLEGGTGLFWGNSVTGFLEFIREATVRTSNASYPYLPPPSGWGYCGTTQSGVASGWDQNTDGTGYRCIDQVGAGQGDLLSGDFPNVQNNTAPGTYTGVWPHQALDPVYAWQNTYNAVPQESHDAYWSRADSAVVENRDYYLELPNYDEPSATFDGTAGVGQGLLAARPATCTPAVGYWATDTQILYQCATANTWTAYYTPYCYPHPLVSGTVCGGTASSTTTGGTGTTSGGAGTTSGSLGAGTTTGGASVGTTQTGVTGAGTTSNGTTHGATTGATSGTTSVSSAGTGGSGAATTAGGSAGGTTGGADGGVVRENVSGGCGCGSGAGADPLLVLSLAFGAGVRRKRRRQRSRGG